LELIGKVYKTKELQSTNCDCAYCPSYYPKSFLDCEFRRFGKIVLCGKILSWDGLSAPWPLTYSCFAHKRGFISTLKRHTNFPLYRQFRALQYCDPLSLKISKCKWNNRVLEKRSVKCWSPRNRVTTNSPWHHTLCVEVTPTAERTLSLHH